MGGGFSGDFLPFPNGPWRDPRGKDRHGRAAQVLPWAQGPDRSAGAAARQRHPRPVPDPAVPKYL